MTTSQPGTTCAALKDIVAKILRHRLPSDFHVDNEVFSNVSPPVYVPGLTTVKEYIAPGSLAYYYVK